MGLKKDSRRYADRREYLIAAVQRRRKKIREMAIRYNCHREVHSGLQLSREIGIEKSGEFREA